MVRYAHNIILSHLSDSYRKEKVVSTSTESYLLDKYGPLLSLLQLANVLDRSADGLRLSLSQDGEMSKKFNPARKKIGRRVYFRSALVALVLDEVEG